MTSEYSDDAGAEGFAELDNDAVEQIISFYKSFMENEEVAPAE
jgi:hypothetical protein